MDEPETNCESTVELRVHRWQRFRRVTCFVCLQTRPLKFRQTNTNPLSSLMSTCFLVIDSSVSGQLSLETAMAAGADMTAADSRYSGGACEHSGTNASISICDKQ